MEKIWVRILERVSWADVKRTCNLTGKKTVVVTYIGIFWRIDTHAGTSRAHRMMDMLRSEGKTASDFWNIWFGGWTNDYLDWWFSYDSFALIS